MKECQCKCHPNKAKDALIRAMDDLIRNSDMSWRHNVEQLKEIVRMYRELK